MTLNDSDWIGWFDELADNDFVVVDDFLSEEMFATIMDFFKKSEENDSLRKAGIGSSGELQIQPDIRGDYIHWLVSERDQEIKPLFDLMDQLTDNLKKYCFLSLSGSEFHIAKYPPGSHYSRHLDQFQHRSNRQITVLIYLNHQWKSGDGGELRIFRDTGDILIQPVARRLLLFRSDTVEHEVLVTHVPRYSFTGWLLKKEADLMYL
jgi:SM-20-related protein